MMNNKKIFTTNQKKSNIGFFHGFISIIGGIILGYLIMMVFSKYMIGDNAIKIMPSIIITPITISFAGLWLLFSTTLFSSSTKFITASSVCILIIEVF